jgi:Cytochrome C'
MSYRIQTNTRLIVMLPFTMVLMFSCSNSSENERAAQYKSLLQLPTTPLSYHESMKRFVNAGYQIVLEQLAESSGLTRGNLLANDGRKSNSVSLEPFQQTLDMAVHIDNILYRTDWSALKSREIEPAAFDALVHRSIGQANDLASAAAAQDRIAVQRAAAQLLLSCQSCHSSYR